MYYDQDIMYSSALTVFVLISVLTSTSLLLRVNLAASVDLSVMNNKDPFLLSFLSPLLLLISSTRWSLLHYYGFKLQLQVMAGKSKSNDARAFLAPLKAYPNEVQFPL